MMRKNPDHGTLQWKVLALVGLILLLILVLVFQQKKRDEYKEERDRQEGTENVMGETEADSQMDTELLQETAQAISNWVEVEETVAIANLQVYATPSMGQSAALLEQSLSRYVAQQQLAATGGIIVHVMVPDSDPESVYYYVQLNDPAGTICLLTYHPREDVVTASACSYSLEEVLAESWQSDAPAIRDVPPEEDAVYQEGQAAQEAAPEAAPGIVEDPSAGTTTVPEEVHPDENAGAEGGETL